MLISVVLAAALTATPPKGFAAFGGARSCATWQSSAAEIDVGKWWIWGFWSGRNSVLGAHVGGGTDGEGIVAEIKLACSARPSATLAWATIQVFERMKAEGR